MEFIYELCNVHICQQSHRSEPAVTYKIEVKKNNVDFGFDAMMIEFKSDL